ncbi:MAG: hypothetical protein ACO1OB_03725 [Archangium sp.]
MQPILLTRVKTTPAPKPPMLPVDNEPSPLLDAIRAYLDGR